MEKKFLDIHFERCPDNRELKRIVGYAVPCAISIAPYTLKEADDTGDKKEYGWYSGETIELIKHGLTSGRIILGQQGNMHRCPHKHKRTDPWHENYCLYKGELPEHRQRILMRIGRESLEKVFGQSPQMYVPPNHLFGNQTLKIASEIMYRFFAERGISQKAPYSYQHPNNNKELIVLPEVKIKDHEGRIFYIHYDEIDGAREKYEAILAQAADFREIKPEQVSQEEIDGNMQKVKLRKFSRDVLKFLKLRR